jgi:UDP-MurNAc hydroxylase
MRVRHIYSACTVIETADISICTDPWMTPGAFDGSWWQYPPIEDDPIEVIGKVDAIYITHIHPDHYDPVFLRSYLSTFPDTALWIGETDPPYLLQKMRADGFAPLVVGNLTTGSTSVTTVANGTYGDDIDTALIVAFGNQSVVNLNDNPFDADQVQLIKQACPGGRPTAAFLPYAGAGPWPQTYGYEPEVAMAKAAWKKNRFLELFTRYIDVLNPEVAVPFAGQYVLAGPLSELNSERGMADAVEAAALRPGIALALEDGGSGVIDLQTLSPSGVRTTPYLSENLDKYLAETPFPGYDYEREVVPLHGRALPLIPVLQAAVNAARRRIPLEDTCWICIGTGDSDRLIAFDASKSGGPVELRADVEDLVPRLEVRLDERYLFGLLTRLYHWNNAEIGSHLSCRRVPDVHRRDVHSFLARLHV